MENNKINEKETESEIKHKQNKINVNSCLFILSILFLGGFLITSGFLLNLWGRFEKYSKIESVLQLYSQDYINDYDEDYMLEYAVKGLIAASGDKYGGYLLTDDVKTSEKIKDGKYLGLGITYQIKDDYIDIIEVVKNSPAGRSGLSVGDKIIAINNKTISEETIDWFRSNTKENEEQVFTFTLDSGKDINISMGLVDFPKIEYHIDIDNDVAFLDIYTFVLDTVPLFKSAIDELEKSSVSNLVVDLRDNSGGDLNAVVSMLDYILSDCTIVTLENNKNETNSIDSDIENNLSNNINIKILVNSNTASASELFTMVLQEQRNAEVFGETTYGKSTVLSYYSFKDESVFILSTGLYYPESGRNIEGIGIEPDKLLNETDIVKDASELYLLGSLRLK